jgi:NADH:ubiquinone oxidoreductase subunit 3 (subunit A)
MQEDQTVQFAPEYIDRAIPWWEALFVYYLVAMAILILFRLTKFALALRKIRKLRADKVPEFPIIQALWTECYEKANSLRNWASLTFLFSILFLSGSTVDDISAFSSEKLYVWQPIMRGVAEALIPFMIGTVICIGFLVSAMMMQHILRRRKPNSPTSAL